MTRRKMNAKDQRKVFGRLAQKTSARNKSKSSILAMKPFDDHPFYKNLMKYAVIPLWEENRRAKKENREIENLSEELIYHFRVFEYSAPLYEALKRLHDIPLFTLKGFSQRWMSNMKLLPQDWFVYNYANYRVVAYGIYDTALLMVNDVLDIKEEPKKVKLKFVNRPEIKNNMLLLSLQKLDKTLEKYRDERHRYVHRSTRPNIDFADNLTGYQLLKEAKEKGLYKGDVPDPKKVYKYYEEERDKQVAKMQNESDEIFAAVIEFLDALNPSYERMIEHYSSKLSTAS